jgi:hypothetical protein
VIKTKASASHSLTSNFLLSAFCIQDLTFGSRKLTTDGCPFTCNSIQAFPISNLGTKAPTAGSTVLDGSIIGWDLTNDYLGSMTNAGNNEKEAVGTAYARYDFNTGTLCVLALSRPGYDFAPVGDGSDAWLKLYGGLSFTNGDKPPGTIVNVGTAGAGQDNGWEGCFTVPAGCYNSVQIHADWSADSPNAPFGNTASTGKTNQGNIGDVTFALCLAGFSCASDTDCKTTCTTATCQNNSCVNPQTKGEDCCATAADCHAGVCQIATCATAVGGIYPSCVITNDNSGACGGGGNDECQVAGDCIAEYPECSISTCSADTITGFKKCSFAENTVNQGAACGDPLYAPVDVCDLGYQCQNTQCKIAYSSAYTDCTTDTVDWTSKLGAGKAENCHLARCTAAAEGDLSGKTTCEVSHRCVVVLLQVITTIFFFYHHHHHHHHHHSRYSAHCAQHYFIALPES